MKPSEIIKDIHWVGYIDWDLRNFHGYSTPSGSTYNAYLILDDKPTLIDTVKHYGYEEMLIRIKEVIDPAKIRYIISNHTEMDHSGSIAKLLELCPQAEVVCSPKGEEGLKRHFLHPSGQGEGKWKFRVVNTGDELDIGKRKLKFILNPMVHWPDSMTTYSPKDKIVFSNDAFGQHYASSERFAEEVGRDIVFHETAKYYANIVFPYGQQVLKLLDAVKDLDIEIICPSHGLIWREKEDIKKLIGLYRKWASYKTDDKVLIVYDTMWHSTEMMATYLYELLYKENIKVKLVSLQNTTMSDVVTEILDSQFVIFGTPMLNNRMLPTMAALIMYLKGLKPKNRFAMTFGSYGWSTTGFKEVEESLKEAGFELPGEGVYIRYIPNESEISQLDSFLSLIKSKMPLDS